MKKICLNIDDEVLKQTFLDLFRVFGFEFTNSKDADFVLDDFGDRIVLNQDKIFMKPVDIFYFVAEMNKIRKVSAFGLLLDEKNKKISFGDEFVLLTDIEVKILSALMIEKAGILSGDLCQRVFLKSEESQMKSLATHIYNLKKKIEKITKKQKNIILDNSRYLLDL